jgi:ABC-type oligopeptide transport system ATPase subunit
MLRPRLIIADEAVSALDVSVGAQVLNLFRELHRDLALGMLFISHNLNLVYYLCDRIAVMKDGGIVEQGNAEEVYRNPRSPYTRALLEAVPELP